MVKQRAHSPRNGSGADSSPTPGMDRASPAPAAKALNAAPHPVITFTKKVLDVDHRASQVLHKMSLYPFDLIIAPFSLLCGIYSIPFLIPLIAYFESIRLAVVILSSV